MSKKKEVVSKYPYPSRFGSHVEMIVEDLGNGNVICKDEFGTYNTNMWYIGKNTMDPNRTAQKRLEKLFAGKKEKDK